MRRVVMAGTTLLTVLLLGNLLGAQEQAQNQISAQWPKAAERDAIANEASQTESGRAGMGYAFGRDFKGEQIFKKGVIPDVPIGSPLDRRPPAKFSEQSEALNRFHVPLTDEQRRAILKDMMNAPNVQGIDPVFQEQLPLTIELNDLPPAAADVPRLQGLKYIRVADRIVFVDSTNRRVVGEVRTTRQSR